MCLNSGQKLAVRNFIKNELNPDSINLNSIYNNFNSNSRVASKERLKYAVNYKQNRETYLNYRAAIDKSIKKFLEHVQ